MFTVVVVAVVDVTAAQSYPNWPLLFLLLLLFLSLQLPRAKRLPKASCHHSKLIRTGHWPYKYNSPDHGGCCCR